MKRGKNSPPPRVTNFKSCRIRLPTFRMPLQDSQWTVNIICDRTARGPNCLWRSRLYINPTANADLIACEAKMKVCFPDNRMSQLYYDFIERRNSCKRKPSKKIKRLKPSGLVSVPQRLIIKHLWLRSRSAFTCSLRISAQNTAYLPIQH